MSARQYSLFDPAPSADEPLETSETVPNAELPAGGDSAAAADVDEPPPSDAPEARVGRLEVLQAAALTCRRCGLAGTRANVVFGEGNPLAPLVLVGEGPGEQEDATGRPFVGRAGKLLDEVLARNRMNRTHVYICNTIKCRASRWENGRLWNRAPSAEEIAACNDWLHQQLSAIRPLVIVCLGAPSASTLIHAGFRMTAERGRWFTNCPYAPWATAAFHPAYILRLQGAAYDAALNTLVDDLDNARKKVIEARRAAAPPLPPAPEVQKRLFD
jgi:DNA polymerase